MKDEQHGTLRQFLIIMISEVRPNPQSSALVRVDNAPGFLPLKSDSTLSSHNIQLDYGRIHNKNKNPVIEKGIRELGSEILRLVPEGGAISSQQLAVIVNQLNSRIRNGGLSAWEILCQRNQYTGEQIDVNDLVLSEQQGQLRVANQQYSSKHKARGNPPAQEANIVKGSLVYIKSDGNKTRGRDRFIVVEVNGDSCVVQKFVKSQLRSKRYPLKLTEVYPVSPDLIEISGKIRDLDSEPVEGEEEYFQHSSQPQGNVASSCTNGPVNFEASIDHPDVAQDNVTVVGVEPTPDESSQEEVASVELNVDSDVPGCEVPSAVPANSNPGRPKRAVSVPAWMRSGEFDLEV